MTTNLFNKRQPLPTAEEHGVPDDQILEEALQALKAVGRTSFYVDVKADILAVAQKDSGFCAKTASFCFSKLTEEEKLAISA